MKSLPTQQRALAKRAALISAAQCSFAELGYNATTAKAIAARAGVATGTFYQYFDNKDDILCTLAQQRLSQLREHIAEPQADTLSEPIEKLFERSLRAIYDFHEHDPQLHQVLEQRRHCDAELAAILDAGEAVLQQRVQRFVRSFNLESPDTVAFNLSAMAEGLVHRHVFNRAEATDKETVIRLGAAMLASYFLCLERT